MSTNDKKTGQAQITALDQSQPQLANVLEAHRGECHVIVIQDYPDPDAISSAYAHQLISAGFDIEVDIIYNGKISHQQNIALVRLLGIELTKFDETVHLEKYNGAIYIDNQGTTADGIVKALEAANVPPLIVVDHHERQERLTPEFSDIRRTGAAATIYAEYLQRGLLKMNKSRQAHVMVATALMHGILTDTNNFTQANEEDFMATAYLSQFRDADLLGQIMSQSRSKQAMEIIHRALGNRVTVSSYSIAGINYLRAEDRDAIPQAADFLLTEENIHTAIVYGIVVSDERGEVLVGSLRTSKITVDPDKFIKEAFGKSEEDHYFGGGKMLAGGFEVPLGFLSGGQSDEEYRNLKWQVYDKQIKQKIFNKIGVEQD